MNNLLENVDIDVLDNEKNPVKVGSVLNDRFILEEKLGEGGIGTIYKARDRRREEVDAENPFIAIKVINPNLQKHTSITQCLQKEVAKTQALNHKHIIRLYDFDRDDETSFITMEYLQGITLDKLLKSFAYHGLSYKKKLNLIIEVGQALQHAHENNIIHGDLKPSNIFITKDGHVKLFDFSFLNSLEHDNNQLIKSTHAFTPSYASIELASGKSITKKDDVYAYACIAYEFLVGYHPYDKIAAKTVNEKNLKPKEIRYMPKHQWNMLRIGLNSDSKKRKTNIKKIVAAFENVQAKQTKYWIAIGIITILAIMYIVNQLDPII